MAIAVWSLLAALSTASGGVLIVLWRSAVRRERTLRRRILDQPGALLMVGHGATQRDLEALLADLGRMVRAGAGSGSERITLSSRSLPHPTTR